MAAHQVANAVGILLKRFRVIHVTYVNAIGM